MAIEITCDCGEPVAFMFEETETLPAERECGGCGTVWMLSATRSYRSGAL